MENNELQTLQPNNQTNNNQKGENDMTEQLEKSVETETTQSGSTENQISTEVTDAPRTDEEMHLKHIREWPDAVKVYLQVSDDRGEVLGKKVLEKKVTEFCGHYADPKTKIEDPEKELEAAKELATRYTLQINMVESGLSGIITKYRTRQGMIFNIMKDLVNAKYGPVWEEWFKSNFDPREFRSVQDYRRLAKIPNIIRYAVFGKERLLQILRQLSKDEKKMDDPVGSFIERVGVDFNPAETVNVQELKTETDIAINLQKLIGKGITEITRDRVETLVRDNREVESVHILELKAAKKAKLDVVARFDEILASKGKLEPLMTPERKAEAFKKNTDRFFKAMESAISDDEYLDQIDPDTIVNLKQKLEQLERLITPST
jgi:hypothetical protein